MRNKLYYSILLFITILIIAIGAMIFCSKEAEMTAANAYFGVSNGSGFYEEDVTVEIKAPRRAEVYYTDDGSNRAALL